MVAVQLVSPGAAFHRISAVASDYLVIAVATHEDVIGIVTGQVVIVGRPGDVFEASAMSPRRVPWRS